MEKQIFYPIIRIPWSLEKILKGDLNDPKLKIEKPIEPQKHNSSSWILLIILPIVSLIICFIYRIGQIASVVVIILSFINGLVVFINRTQKYNKIFTEKKNKYILVKREFDADMIKFGLKGLNYKNLTSEIGVKIKEYLIYKILKKSYAPNYYAFSETTGYSERHFRSILEEHFPGKIFTNRCLEDNEHRRTYIPDIIFRDEQINLNIDIEIDEPYVHATNQPIHFHNYGSHVDKTRDEYFSTRGWIVIRFAEEQVIRFQDECIIIIDYIVKLFTLLENCDYDINSLNECDKISNIKIVRAWSKEEAEDLAKKKYREEYLHKL